jgi:hypothetical protein
MADGRIGYANHQYARVSVTREGIRNGEYYKEYNEIGDRLYQINKKVNYPHHEIPSINMIGRVRYNDISEAINALQNFNNKNCGEYAVELRKNKILKQYEEHKALNIKSYLTKERVKEADTYVEGYNDGFRDGVASIEDKLNKLLNNL